MHIHGWERRGWSGAPTRAIHHLGRSSALLIRDVVTASTSRAPLHHAKGVLIHVLWVGQDHRVGYDRMLLHLDHFAQGHVLHIHVDGVRQLVRQRPDAHEALDGVDPPPALENRVLVLVDEADGHLVHPRRVEAHPGDVIGPAWRDHFLLDLMRHHALQALLAVAHVDLELPLGLLRPDLLASSQHRGEHGKIGAGLLAEAPTEAGGAAHADPSLGAKLHAARTPHGGTQQLGALAPRATRGSFTRWGTGVAGVVGGLGVGVVTEV
eukprot:scaffold1790_cov257-Pinguiococcus_pyrenoidosus.AAC.27